MKIVISFFQNLSILGMTLLLLLLSIYISFHSFIHILLLVCYRCITKWKPESTLNELIQWYIHIWHTVLSFHIANNDVVRAMPRSVSGNGITPRLSPYKPTYISLANLLKVDIISEQDREYGKYFERYSVWVWLYCHVTCQGKTERFVLFSRTKYILTPPKWSAIKTTVRNCDIDSLIV